jgi:hypothetical protein
MREEVLRVFPPDSDGCQAIYPYRNITESTNSTIKRCLIWEQAQRHTIEAEHLRLLFFTTWRNLALEANADLGEDETQHDAA